MSGLPWHKRDHSARYDETRRISPAARGILSDLVDTMYRTGKAIPNDIPYLCHLFALRDKRQVEKPLAELIAAGLIVVTPEGLANKVAMEGIEEANKHISNGKKGGRPAKKVAAAPDQPAISVRSVPDRFPITAQTEDGGFEQNQSLSQNPLDKDKKENKTHLSPLPPQPTGNGRANGSVVGERDPVQTVIQEFDRLLIEFFGKQAARRFQANTDAATAATLLDVAGGDVGRVVKAMDECIAEHVDQGGQAPNALRFYGNPVSRAIVSGPKLATMTAMSKPGAGQAKAGPKPVWLEVRKLATDNFHDDIAKQIRALAGSGTPEETAAANDFAESVRGLVSRKKERAAA